MKTFLLLALIFTIQSGFATESQELPKVLILGDSISIGYTKMVTDGLSEIALVSRPKDNCGDTPRGLANLEKWLGTEKWDLIHFNWGLWDLAYRNPKLEGPGRLDKKEGTLSVPLPDYEKNLETLVTHLKKTGAVLIWASTTTVPEGEKGRFAGDEIKYNAAAQRIMEKHGVIINDLHAISSSFTPDLFVKPGDVHYKPAGSRRLADQVIKKISAALSQQDPHPALIDCHVHLYTLTRPEGVSWIKPDNQPLYRDHLPVDFAKIAQENGVTGVVLVQAGQSIPDNQWTLDISATHPNLFRGVVGNLSRVIGTDQFSPLLQNLCTDPRYLGYRLSGRPENDLDDAFYRHLEETAQAGKTVDFLLGSYTLKEVAEVARRVPKLKIIVNHFGGVRLDGNPLPADWIADFKALAKFPNVTCKVSALFGRFESQPAPLDLAFYQEILDLAFESFGEDRLIFGSDWPVTKSTGDYASVLKLTRSYFAPKGAKVGEKLFSLNAQKFYALPEAP